MTKYKPEDIKQAVNDIMTKKQITLVNELKGKKLKEYVIQGIYDRLKSYTKYHFRKSNLSLFARKTEALCYIADDNNIKGLSDTLRNDKNQWISKDLWEYVKNNNDLIKQGKQ